MSDLTINNVRIISGGAITSRRCVTCRDGRIFRVEDAAGSGDDSGEVIDGENMYLVPGFIDLHIHGSGDYLVDNGPDDLSGLCRELPKYGVTGFLPTVCPLPPGQDERFVASLASVVSQGSAILGIHLEGPFVAISGALPPEVLRDADVDRVHRLRAASGQYRAIFSVSPEIDGAPSIIKAMSAGGSPVFITHTGADVEQTRAAIDAGARHATHFYDVFPVPEQCEPGVRQCGAVEAILADPNVSVDFILDGEHVDPVAVALALQCKGAHGVSLITDANVGAGKAPGVYEFAGAKIEFRYPGGPARKTSDSRSPGTLAGSGLTMDAAIRNAVKMLKLDLPTAVDMASRNPAAVLGLDHNKGSIKPDYDADMTLLDSNLAVQTVWVGGRCVFNMRQ